ncbi:hypothetical protein LINPERPRIM_LOCUS13075 [Linum perenne]
MMNSRHSMHLLLFLFPLLLLLLTHPCHSSTTILVNGVSSWSNPSIFLGDSIIFKHKYGYNLYIFQSLRAFDLCNLTQATLLTNPTSHSYSWHTSRPGFFYFAFSNGSSSQQHCYCSQKLASTHFPPTEAPTPSIPEPISGGGVVASSPAFPWPFKPREKRAAVWAPAPEPVSSGGGGGVYGRASSPMRVPKLLPGINGGETPFINSNPAVPLPTGEVDSATIRPQSTSATSGCHQQLLMQMRRKGSVGADNMVGVCGVILLIWLWK